TVLVGSTSTQELEGFSVQVYPNPVHSSSEIYLQWNSHTTFAGQATWLSIGGQIIDSQKLNSSSNQELLSTTAPAQPGMYILQLRSENGRQNHYRIAVF